MNAVSGTRNETLGHASADAISLNVGFFARRAWFEWVFALVVVQMPVSVWESVPKI